MARPVVGLVPAAAIIDEAPRKILLHESAVSNSVPLFATEVQPVLGDGLVTSSMSSRDEKMRISNFSQL